MIVVSLDFLLPLLLQLLHLFVGQARASHNKQLFVLRCLELWDNKSFKNIELPQVLKEKELLSKDGSEARREFPLLAGDAFMLTVC